MRSIRTLMWALALGVVAVLAVRPLDALGEVLLLPPSYRPGVRIFLGCLWALGVATVWSYRPSSVATEPPDEDH